MGRIAWRRGGAGGRNAPPQTYSPFVDFEDGPGADPIGAIVDVLLFLGSLVVIGFSILIYKAFGK